MRNSTVLEDRFTLFDNANPVVWRLFVRFTLEAVNTGRKRLGAKAVVERIRWETALTTTDANFKVNNNHTAYYARKFEEAHPRYAGLFSTRKVKGEKCPLAQSG